MRSDVAISDIWFYSIPIVFAVSFSVLIPLIIKTYRSPDRTKKTWWNCIEIMWLLVATLGVAGAVSSSLPTARGSMVGTLESMAEDAISVSSTTAWLLSETNCDQENEAPICDALAEVAKLDLNASSEQIFSTWNDYSIAARELERLDPVRIGGAIILYKLSDALTLKLDAEYEAGRRFDWLDRFSWLIVIWPHLLSFAVAIRLARATAAFAFP